MKNYGRAALSEFLGERIVYRNLQPCDLALPRLDEIRKQAGMLPGHIPRKHEPEYAMAVQQYLLMARSQDGGGRRIERLIFVGDTRLLDGMAFANLCLAGGWAGRAFIGSENKAPAEVRLETVGAGQTLFLANRWSALADFDRQCNEVGLPVDENAAVVVDLDKTALGARGRNAQVIDRARALAVEQTVAGLLGDAFDLQLFMAAYDPLNQPEFHPFTADNQDYLAYICLMLVGGLYGADKLMADVRGGRMASFAQFIAWVDGHQNSLKPQLQQMHSLIYGRVQAGDPTPFKEFRRTEYSTTLQRMGCLPDGAPMDQLLTEEILVTQEVRQWALEWRRRGALLFGLSDKPDEAALPTPELAAQGALPLHQAVTHAVGES